MHNSVAVTMKTGKVDFMVSMFGHMFLFLSAIALFTVTLAFLLFSLSYVTSKINIG